MKEILFRGCNGFGNWFYGGYVYCKSSETHNIVNENTSRSFDWFDVIMETVGQYTGLKDKNGVKIFEGDILANFEGVESIGNVHHIVEYYEDSLKWSLVINYGETLDVSSKIIIGNIHEGDK